jgi:hypothetical protein
MTGLCDKCREGLMMDVPLCEKCRQDLSNPDLEAWIANSPAQAKRDKLKICFTCACYLYNKNTEPCKDCDGFYNNRWRAIS